MDTSLQIEGDPGRNRSGDYRFFCFSFLTWIIHEKIAMMHVSN